MSALTDAYLWHGVGRSGRACMGGGLQGEPSLESFVHAKFRAGWRSLTVHRGGEVVGEINRLDGPRHWWAEA